MKKCYLVEKGTNLYLGIRNGKESLIFYYSNNKQKAFTFESVTQAKSYQKLLKETKGKELYIITLLDQNVKELYNLLNEYGITYENDPCDMNTLYIEYQGIEYWLELNTGETDNAHCNIENIIQTIKETQTNMFDKIQKDDFINYDYTLPVTNKVKNETAFVIEKTNDYIIVHDKNFIKIKYSRQWFTNNLKNVSIVEND